MPDRRGAELVGASTRSRFICGDKSVRLAVGDTTTLLGREDDSACPLIATAKLDGRIRSELEVGMIGAALTLGFVGVNVLIESVGGGS